MSKQGMARPDTTEKPKKDVPQVPEIPGKGKPGKDVVKPIIAGTEGANMKVYHALKPEGALSATAYQQDHESKNPHM